MFDHPISSGLHFFYFFIFYSQNLLSNNMSYFTVEGHTWYVHKRDKKREKYIKGRNSINNLMTRNLGFDLKDRMFIVGVL